MPTRHVLALRQSILVILGASGLLPACAAATKTESTTSGGPGDVQANGSPGPAATTATVDTRPPPTTEAKVGRVCSVAIAAGSGAKSLACRDVLSQVPKSSNRACENDTTCDRGERCYPDATNNKVCVHLRGQTLDCGSDLDCAEGARCVLSAGDIVHGTCTRDTCGATCAAGNICAPYFVRDTSYDLEEPPGQPVQSSQPGGLMCLPAAAKTYQSSSPPSGPCRVVITTTCEVVGTDWQCALSGGLGRHACGRPLLVAGEARVASSDRASTGAHSGDAWVARVRAIAYEEHASVVAFARAITQLAALGAPMALLQKTSAALADEIEHARLAFELLRELDRSAERERPGAFPDALAPLGEIGDLRRALLEDTILGGAIGESGSVLDALEARDGSPEPVRRFLDRIADDETRHAALAFETIAWLAGDDPELWRMVDATIGHAPRGPLVDAVVRPVLATMRAS